MCPSFRIVTEATFAQAPRFSSKPRSAQALKPKPTKPQSPKITNPSGAQNTIAQLLKVRKATLQSCFSLSSGL